jgi:prephenate dehydrogenase
MQKLRCVAIVGVGLIGASLGMALRRKGLAERVVGIGRRHSSLRIARQAGAVTSATVNLANGVARAELIVVCSPVGKIVEHVRLAAEHAPEGTLITDAGSAKRSIVETVGTKLARGCRFVGSHPIAGSEKSGPEHATADLFEGRLVAVTPTRNTREEDCTFLERFWSGLGSVVVRMSPAEHDRALAVTSHLPHAVAVVLAGTLPEKYFPLVGTGFLDTSRLAGGSPQLWTDIFSTNRRNVARALAQFEKRIAALRAAVLDDNPRRLERIFTEAKKNRDALGS